MALRRKVDAPGKPEDEREALRRQRLESARELELLKRELGERIAAVRQREQELEAALGHAAPGTALAPLRPPRLDPIVDQELSARGAALERRERELAARERDLAERERASRENPPDPSAERLAQIEASPHSRRATDAKSSVETIAAPTTNGTFPRTAAGR